MFHVCACDCVLGAFGKVLWNSLKISPSYKYDGGKSDYHSTLTARTVVTAPRCAHRNVTKCTQNYNCDVGTLLELH